MTVRVPITPVNGHHPIFLCSPYYKDINEVKSTNFSTNISLEFIKNNNSILEVFYVTSTQNLIILNSWCLHGWAIVQNVLKEQNLAQLYHGVVAFVVRKISFKVFLFIPSLVVMLLFY